MSAGLLAWSELLLFAPGVFLTCLSFGSLSKEIESTFTFSLLCKIWFITISLRTHKLLLKGTACVTQRGIIRIWYDF